MNPLLRRLLVQVTIHVYLDKIRTYIDLNFICVIIDFLNRHFHVFELSNKKYKLLYTLHVGI